MTAISLHRRNFHPPSAHAANDSNPSGSHARSRSRRWNGPSHAHRDMLQRRLLALETEIEELS